MVAQACEARLKPYPTKADTIEFRGENKGEGQCHVDAKTRVSRCRCRSGVPVLGVSARSGSDRRCRRSGAGLVPVTDEMLRDPDPADWLMIHRTYDFQSFSPLDQINRDNVGQLRVAWMRAMDEGPQEIRPLVHDGVMYIAHPGGDHLEALDATTGDRLWDYERTLPEDLREYATLGSRTRHLALYGTHVYHLSADAFLVALDAQTGEVAWETEMADYRQGITHSSGAMIINGMVVSGRTCSPSSLEARCFVAAHDADTGNELWRTYTAAGADDPGGNTWGICRRPVGSMSRRGGCLAATTPS